MFLPQLCWNQILLHEDYLDKRLAKSGKPIADDVLSCSLIRRGTLKKTDCFSDGLSPCLTSLYHVAILRELEYFEVIHGPCFPGCSSSPLFSVQINILERRCHPHTHGWSSRLTGQLPSGICTQHALQGQIIH